MSDQPGQSVYPAIRYRDANAAIDWLRNAFGFEATAVHRGDDGSVAHAELRLGSSTVMLGGWREGGWMDGSEPDPLRSTISLYAVVGDPDAHHDRAVAAGAEVVRGLEDMDYGSREYSARDLDGNLWSFGTYAPGG
jgi:uncharacterized glyoxalase superfamily protein PhnB